MDLNFLQEYIIPVALGISYIVGYLVKNYLPTDNKHIPTIVTAVGVLVTIWANGWAVTPEILLQGMVSGIGSTGVHELVRNYTEKSGE